MSKLEDIAMRESPLLKALAREERKAASFADQFLHTYYGLHRAAAVAIEPSDTVTVTALAPSHPDAWLQAMQDEVDAQLKGYGESLNRYLLCTVHPADKVIAKHMTPRCECGSGSDDPSGAHSHWCQLWIAP